MMTILADSLGVISVSAYGVRSRKSKTRIRLFSCADFVLSKKGDIYRMEQMDLVDAFFPICEDIAKLSLANYMSDLAKDAFAAADRDILKLLLNTMYVISYRETDLSTAKAVYELKIAQYMGYEPHIASCVSCGNLQDFVAFDMESGVKCKNCKTIADYPMVRGVYEALKYILQTEDTKIFSFEVSDEVKKELCKIAEKYIVSKTERNYKSLDYIKKIM